MDKASRRDRQRAAGIGKSYVLSPQIVRDKNISHTQKDKIMSRQTVKELYIHVKRLKAPSDQYIHSLPKILGTYLLYRFSPLVNFKQCTNIRAG